MLFILTRWCILSCLRPNNSLLESYDEKLFVDILILFSCNPSHLSFNPSQCSCVHIAKTMLDILLLLQFNVFMLELHFK